MRERGFRSLPDEPVMPTATALPAEVVRLGLNGRATDSQFAQNPLPVLTSMGVALAQHHQRSIAGLKSKTTTEVEAALRSIESGIPLPYPFDRARPETIVRTLEAGPPAARPSVCCHGSPVVSCAILTDSVTSFEGSDGAGADPAERDLAIVLRSIAETFAPEASRTFLDAYELGGGALPDGPTLDWYGLVAAFR